MNNFLQVSEATPPYPRNISTWWLQCAGASSTEDTDFGSADPAGTLVYWGNDLLQFEPVPPSTTGYYDRENQVVQLSTTPVVENEQEGAIVDSSLDPRKLAQYNTVRAACYGVCWLLWLLVLRLDGIFKKRCYGFRRCSSFW